MVGSYFSPNSLYLNDGNGNYSTYVDTVDSKKYTKHIRCMDIDGDGDIDIWSRSPMVLK